MTMATAVACLSKSLVWPHLEAPHEWGLHPFLSDLNEMAASAGGEKSHDAYLPS